MPGKLYLGLDDLSVGSVSIKHRVAKSYCEGREANVKGLPDTANPHDATNTEAFTAWAQGWDDQDGDLVDISLTGCAVSQLPQIAAIPDQTDPTGSLITPLDLNTFMSGAGTITVVADPLPTSLSDAAGIVTGTPTVEEVVEVLVTATNANGVSGASFTWTITAP